MRLIAIVGLLLSLLIAVGAVLVLRSMPAKEQVANEARRNQIVVAADDLRFGQKITAGNVRVIDWYADKLPDGAIRSIEELNISPTGPYLLSSVPAGTPLQRSRISAPGQKPGLSSLLSPGTVAVTMQVNTITGVAGFVLPDERVDILLTRAGNSGQYTDIILENVRVLAVDSAIDTGSGNAMPAKSVTFEVAREDAQKLILAKDLGSISLALRNLSTDPFAPARRVNANEVMTGAPAPATEGSTQPTAPAQPTATPASPSATISDLRVVRGLVPQSYAVPLQAGP